jgi:hypothetical protein
MAKLASNGKTGQQWQNWPAMAKLASNGNLWNKLINKHFFIIIKT